MTDELNPKRIAQLLTQSTWRMDSDVLDALSNAREKALQRQSVRVPVLALAGDRWVHLLPSASARHWLSAGLLAAVVVIGASYWHNVREQQIADLDVAILTDDLPIEVFVN